jgi:quercetin dioxygenase-like cupin family protein
MKKLEPIQLKTGDVLILPDGDNRKLRNTSDASAKFMTAEVLNDQNPADTFPYLR